MPNTAMMPMLNAPIPSLFPDLSYQSQNKIIRGNGQLSWLSSKAGVIQCSTMNASVSFQLKDFCDQVCSFDKAIPIFRLFRELLILLPFCVPVFVLHSKLLSTTAPNGLQTMLLQFKRPKQSTKKKSTWKNLIVNCHQTFAKLHQKINIHWSWKSKH